MIDKPRHDPPSDIPDFTTASALAKAWKLPDDTVRKWVRNNTIPGRKVGGKVLVDLDALREMFDDDGTPRTKA